jgi:hypothetical protein
MRKWTVSYERGTLTDKEKIQADYFLQELNFNNQNINFSEQTRHNINFVIYPTIVGIWAFSVLVMQSMYLNDHSPLWIFYWIVFCVIITIIFHGYGQNKKCQIEKTDNIRLLRMCELELELNKISDIDLNACRERIRISDERINGKVKNIDNFTVNQLQRKIEDLKLQDRKQQESDTWPALIGNSLSRFLTRDTNPQ